MSDSGEGDEWFESRSRTRKVEKKITALGSEIHTSTNSVCLPDVGPVERSMRHRDEKIKEKNELITFPNSVKHHSTNSGCLSELGHVVGSNASPR